MDEEFENEEEFDDGGFPQQTDEFGFAVEDGTEDEDSDFEDEDSEFEDEDSSDEDEVDDSYDDDEAQPDEEEDIEPTDDEIQSVLYPDFIDEELQIPDNFRNQKQELAWYREHYPELVKKHETPEFVGYVAEKFKDHLIKQQNDVQELLAIREAMHGNPQAAFKLFMPDTVVKFSGPPTLSDEETEQLIYDTLSKEFGDDFQEKIDPHEINRATSFSSKVYRRREELYNYIQNHNEEFTQKPNQVNQEQIAKTIETEYPRFKQEYGMTRQQYDDFIAESSKRNLSLDDVFLIVNKDRILKSVEQRAYEKGKKEALSNIKRAGEKLTPKFTNGTKKRVEEDFVGDIRNSFYNNKQRF